MSVAHLIPLSLPFISLHSAFVFSGPAPRQELSELGLNGVAHEKREGMRGPCRVSKNVAMGMRRDLHSVHEPVGSSGQRARSWRALKTREE